MFDVLLTGTLLLTTDNPGQLPLRSQIQQIPDESGTIRIWDHDTGLNRHPCRRSTGYTTSTKYKFEP